MKLEKLPLYYQMMVEKIEDDGEIGLTENENTFVSNYHHSSEYKPQIFYKAVSKIICFGIDNRKEV